MKSISATAFARTLADVLDAIESRGESFVVVRRGRPIARIGPHQAKNGAAVKKLLRSAPPDRDWREELAELRGSLRFEERGWSG